VIAIPKAGRSVHVRENRNSIDLSLDDDDLRAIDSAFKPPPRKKPLEMI
jgi:diketogulonate reductase-like aldo/keto reductase